MLSPSILEEIRNGLQKHQGGHVTITLSTGQKAVCFRGKNAASLASEAHQNEMIALSGVEKIDENTYCYISQ